MNPFIALRSIVRVKNDLYWSSPRATQLIDLRSALAYLE